MGFRVDIHALSIHPLATLSFYNLLVVPLPCCLWLSHGVRHTYFSSIIPLANMCGNPSCDHPPCSLAPLLGMAKDYHVHDKYAVLMQQGL